jgi:hypothetical protein
MDGIKKKQQKAGAVSPENERDLELELRKLIKTFTKEAKSQGVKYGKILDIAIVVNEVKE